MAKLRSCLKVEPEMEANRSEDAGDGDDVELLKTRISTHPLYGRLVENHLNCLKVGGIGNGGRSSKGNQRQAENYNSISSNNMKKNPCSSSMQLNQSELDLFMEGYCSALSKLKEAIEEPQLETIALINAMHSQLRDLARANANPFSPDVFLQEAETNDSK